MRIDCVFYLFYAYFTRILSFFMRILCLFYAYSVCFVCCPGDLNPICIPNWRAVYNVSVVSHKTHMSISCVIHVCLARGATRRGADERAGWGVAKDRGEGEKCACMSECMCALSLCLCAWRACMCVGACERMPVSGWVRVRVRVCAHTCVCARVSMCVRACECVYVQALVRASALASERTGVRASGGGKRTGD